MMNPLTLAATLLLLSPALPPQTREPAPAGVPLPELPGIERSEPYLPPTGRRLGANAALADRFTAPGQSVRYPFAARAGELSLFELPATGYARGWSAAVRLRVLDSTGAPLAEQRVAGGVQFRALLPFTAPADGEYVLEVSADQEYFRYQLVRHGNYSARGADAPAQAFGGQRLHGWLAGPGDRLQYLIPVHAGEELVLRVEGTRAEARNERDRARALALQAAGGEAMGASSMRSMQSGRSMTGRAGRGGEAIFPEPRLALDSQALVLARGDSFLRLRAESEGTLTVSVSASAGEQATLFDLLVERQLACVPVAGTVIDADEQGRYAVELPPGDYQIRMQAPDGSVLSVPAGISGPTPQRDLLF